MIGGIAGQASELLGSVEVLAADGSAWTAAAPLATPRSTMGAALMPCGKVVVAGGLGDDYEFLDSVEVWDPETDQWSPLPPLFWPRNCPAVCALPSGGVAVAGGLRSWDELKTVEVLPGLGANDVWEMGTSMQASRRNHSLLPVAGGMIAVGGDMGGLAEVYDEASRRWYALPGSSHLIGDNWCDDALEAEKFGMEVVVQLPAAALR